jgi:hypothetical protein
MKARKVRYTNSCAIENDVDKPPPKSNHTNLNTLAHTVGAILVDWAESMVSEGFQAAVLQAFHWLGWCLES